jgi:DNA primase catalytic core
LFDNISQALEEIDSRLDPQSFFNSPSHNFKSTRDKLRGGCPWHDSQSGTAFHVFLKDNTWQCPSCGIGGRPIHYLHYLRNGKNAGQLRGSEFSALLKEMAQMTGVTLPEKESTPEQKEFALKVLRRQQLLRAYQALAVKSQTPEGLAYLVGKRHLPLEKLEEICVGLGPDAATVETELTAQGFDFQELIDCGLLVSTMGRLFAPMEGYLIFPWNDSSGQLMSLYGRYLGDLPPGSKKPKTRSLRNAQSDGDVWLKGKQSPLGLDLALKARHKNLTVVEGLIDGYALQFAGDTSVIAWVANRPSAEQVETLAQRKIESVIICLDPDVGGEKGTPSSIKALAQQGITSFVMPWLPDGQDPDEFLHSQGMEAWESLKKQKIHGFRHLIDLVLEGYDTDDKGRYLDGDMVDIQRKLVDTAKDIEHPALVDEINQFYWSVVKEKTGHTPGQTQANNSTSTATTKDSNKLTGEELLITIRNVLMTSTKEVGDLEDLRSNSTIASERKFYEIVEEIRTSIGENVQEQQIDFKDLHTISHERLDLFKIFPNKLAATLVREAEFKLIDPIYYLQNILPASCCMIGNRAGLVVQKATTTQGSWIEPAVLWCPVASISGDGKSPALKLIFAAILDKQRQADEAFREKKELYDLKVNNWKNLGASGRKENSESEPGTEKSEVGVQNIMVFDGVTMEALLRRLAEHELANKDKGSNGSVWLKDELMGLFTGLDQYKGGNKGDSRQTLLSLWNGSWFRVDRMKYEDSFSMEKPRLSIAGGLHPSKLSQIFNDPNDADGLLARFLLAFPADIAQGEIPEDTEIESNTIDVLTQLFNQVENMALGNITMSKAARAVWRKYHKSVAKARFLCKEENPAFSNFLAKCVSHCARIALVLHHLEHAFEPKNAPHILNPDTMKRAVHLMGFYIRQYRLAQSRYGSYQASGSSSLSQDMLAVHEFSEKWGKKGKGGITPINFSSSYAAKKYKEVHGKSISLATTRDRMVALAAIGYGTVTGAGNAMCYVALSGKDLADSIAKHSKDEPLDQNTLNLQAILLEAEEMDVSELVEIPVIETETQAEPVETFVPEGEALDAIDPEAAEESDGTISPDAIKAETGDYVELTPQVFQTLHLPNDLDRSWEIVAHDTERVKVFPVGGYLVVEGGDRVPVEAQWINRAGIKCLVEFN